MKNHQNREIDMDDVKTRYESNPLFRTLIDFLAKQDEDESQISVDALMRRMNESGLSVGRQDAVRMLRELAFCDCGWFTVGRRHWPSRFDFNISMTELAKGVTGTGTLVQMTPAAKMIAHKFRLRPELEITVELPDDLSDKEVARIAGFLKTLPFEHAGSSMAA